jgi:hypothetical protein
MAVTYVSANVKTSNLVTVPESYHDALGEFATWETPLLDLIGFNSLKGGCTSTTHYYNEMPHTPKRGTIYSSFASGDTHVHITPAIFSAGEWVLVGDETVKLGDTSDNLDFGSAGTATSRSVGAVPAATWAAGTTVIGLGIPQIEGFAASTTAGDFYPQPNKVTAYPMIFKYEVMTSDTANAVPRYGRPGSEFDYQIALGMRYIKKSMQAAILGGVAQACTASAAGVFPGLLERCYSASYYTNLSSGSYVTLDYVRLAVRTLKDAGFNPNFIASGLYSQGAVNAWAAGGIVRQLQPGEPGFTTFGNSVNVMNVDGSLLICVPMNDLQSTVVVGDSTSMGFGPLQGMALHLKPLDGGGSRSKALLQGQYVFECPGPGAYTLLRCKYS